MRQSIAKCLAPLLMGLAMLALVFIAVGVEADTGDIDINGLYWADGDYLDYNFISESEPDGRGFLYANRAGPGLIKALVRVSHNANDLAFEPDKTDYTASVGWTPAHRLFSLEQSDHMELFLECGEHRWEWFQDLVYDADAGPGFDWRSDYYGPDSSPFTVTSSTGAAIPSSGIVLDSHSSLEYNLENSSWFLINQMALAPTNPSSWTSLDLPPMGAISRTVVTTDVNTITGVHEDYPFFRSTGAAPGDLYEWEISYEMLLDDSHCPEGVPSYIGTDSAHNSPSKIGTEDIIIPTAIQLTSIEVSSGSRYGMPMLLIGAALLALSVAVSILMVRNSKDSGRI